MVETAAGPASRQPGDEQVAGLLADAAAAEGGYESLMVRIALEHDLTRDEQAAAWCLRFAFKQLRYAVRENRPLQWWRSDFRNEPQVSSGYREYLAFKSLVPRVARILVEARKPAPGASDRQPRCHLRRDHRQRKDVRRRPPLRPQDRGRAR